MHCFNCNRPLPDDAKVCGFCEAPVTEPPTPEEMEDARQMLDQLPPDVAEEIFAVFKESATADEFVNRIFVGSCPKCASDNTGDCENDPEIDNLLVGRCFDCGQLWCTECERLLTREAHACICLDEDDDDE